MSSIEFAFDLDAYFARIGYAGPREPTLRVLAALHRLHPAAIPFEAIDVLLGHPISLSPADIFAKLVTGGRGGYCFEQSSLFRLALAALGFRVTPLIARSWFGRPLDQPRPRTHMALRVDADGQAWLADVGFSKVTLTSPLRLAEIGPQALGPWESVRLVPQPNGERRYEILSGTAWRVVYDLAADPPLDVDLEAANWFVATHPSSIFRTTLMVTRTTDAARYVLVDGQLTVRRPHGAAWERHILGADALEACLARDFGLSPQPSWRGLIERAAAASLTAS